jgi:hypothetical protein
VAKIQEKRNIYRILERKPAGKRPLGIPGRRLEGSIKMDHKKVGYVDGR